MIWVPQCVACKRFHTADRDKETCDAYPEGIPQVILRNKFIHTKPFQGDHGLQFVPLTE